MSTDMLLTNAVGQKGELGTAQKIGGKGGGGVTPERIVNATGQMTAEQAQQTRENIGAGEPLTPAQIATGAGTWLSQNLATPSTPPIDSSLSVANAAADAKTVGDKLLTDTEITWNQLAPPFTRASGTMVGGVTYTRSADKMTANFNGTATTSDFYQVINSGIGTSISGHKYLLLTDYSGGSASTYFFYIYSRDARDFGDGVIWTATSAVNITFGIEIRKNSVLNNLTIPVPIICDLTAMFGAGNEPSIGEFKAMFPESTYARNTGTTRKITKIEEQSRKIYNLDNTLEKCKNSVALKIMTFNCGHYNYGASGEGDWSGNELQSKIKEWKDMLAKYKPDILLGQEMSNYFDSAQTVNAIEAIFRPLLPNYYFYAWTRLLSKIQFERTWQIDLAVTVSGTTYSRSAGAAIININGVEIAICSIHLPPGYTQTDSTVREAMLEKVLTALSDYEYVVIGGDFNESSSSFYTPLETAGYSLLNHGYFGDILTTESEAIDNIAVKGFTFYTAECDSADSCTSDHYPVASIIHVL